MSKPINRHPRAEQQCTHANQRRRRRGAVTLEAVAVLPLLILLFVSVIYVRDHVLNKQHAELQARTCVWLYAANNCRFEGSDGRPSVPASCHDVLDVQKNAADWDAAKDIQDEMSSFNDGGDLRKAITNIAMEALSHFINKAVTRAAVARVERELTVPAVFGGGTRIVVGDYRLTCNLQPTTAIDVAKQAWSTLVP